jgi:hypothetical protein
MRTQGAWYELEEMFEAICGDWEGYCASDGYRVIMRAKELEAELMACLESFPYFTTAHTMNPLPLFISLWCFDGTWLSYPFDRW